MKSSLLLLFAFIMLGCGGTLSDEQRKQMREARESQAVQRVSDAMITEAAYNRGRALLAILEKTNWSAAQLDSLAAAEEVSIHWLEPGKSGHEIESQLIEAYIVSAATGQEQADNIQRIGTDTLLYTKAVVVRQADSSALVKGTWNIWLPKRQLVLSLNK